MKSLDKRPCKIGNINPRRENHGEEKVPAIDVSLAGIFLNKRELGELVGNKHCWDGLFDEKGKLAEPAMRCFKPIGLDLSFENATVSLYVGLKLGLIELTECKLTKLKIAPQVGGLTELTLTVQAVPDMDAVAAPLINWMGHDADVALNFGDISADEKERHAKENPELALGHADPGDDDGDDDEAAEVKRAPKKRSNGSAKKPAKSRPHLNA
jgi:hypothetical protein